VHAHDLPLNVLIENGLLGLGALGYVIVAQVAAWRRAARASAAQGGERSLLFFGLTAAFAASALQNSIDLVTTFVFLLWWPMMGLMLGMSRAEAHGD
jgi:O-antigen ligase